jgi:hypothetical protein
VGKRSTLQEIKPTPRPRQICMHGHRDMNVLISLITQHSLRERESSRNRRTSAQTIPKLCNQQVLDTFAWHLPPPLALCICSEAARRTGRGKCIVFLSRFWSTFTLLFCLVAEIVIGLGQPLLNSCG